jgi:hypothetical protein
VSFFACTMYTTPLSLALWTTFKLCTIVMETLKTCTWLFGSVWTYIQSNFFNLAEIFRASEILPAKEILPATEILPAKRLWTPRRVQIVYSKTCCKDYLGGGQARNIQDDFFFKIFIILLIKYLICFILKIHEIYCCEAWKKRMKIEMA